MNTEEFAGALLLRLENELSDWSQATFGSDSQRGPVPPLEHLAKEVQEVLEDPSDTLEYADCLLLLIDAYRRNGRSVIDLITTALQKLEINKTRTWERGENGMISHIE